MTFADRLWRGLVCLVCATFVSCSTSGERKGLSGTATSNASGKEIKGQLVPSSQPLKFKTDSGTVYTLVSNRTSSALFIDTNLQTKTLLLKGKVLPDRRLEVTGNLRSIHEGKVRELYYYCDICAIKGIDPGPCMCCREPVHLVEEPVK